MTKETRKNGKVIEIRKNGSKRVHTVNIEKSKTDQQWKNDTDINYIMDSYLKKGEIPLFVKRRQNPGTYQDVSQIPDLLGAYEQVSAAESAMADLPAAVRAKFKNDPNEMIKFLQDPKNLEESYELGMRDRPKQKPSTETPKTTETLKTTETPKIDKK